MSLTFEGDGTISGFDAGLSGFGGLVAVKHAIFTGTQTASTAPGANFAVTDLSITHACADAANKLIISAFLGAAASSYLRAGVGLAIHDGTSLIAIGNAASNRTRVTAGGYASSAGTDDSSVVTMPSITFVHTPGDTSSRTFTVRAINTNSSTDTIQINRSHYDGDYGFSSRAVSSLVIQEVSV